MIFIRHAETDLAGTFCGQTDPPLNERGHQQVAALVIELEGTPIDAIYSSDLRRAHATAQAIAHCRGLICHLRPALREIDFGVWEGLTWNEIEQRDAAFAEAWSRNFPALTAPDGERFADFERRVLTAVSELSAEPMQHTVVVTHAGVLRLILERLCNVAPEMAWERSRQFCSIVSCLTLPDSSLAARVSASGGQKGLLP
jgi:alpha-ribazole phosphatase